MVGSPLRMLRRRGSGAAREPLTSSVEDQHTHVDASGGNDSSVGPATAGTYAPERAALQEQIVLLLHKRNTGILGRLGRRLAVWLEVYNMSMAFNCVEPWEQAIGNTVVLGAIALIALAAWRETNRALAFASYLMQTWSGSR